MNEQATFDRFLQPHSVAIVGASPQRGNPRNGLVRNLQKHGFAGRIYPVSPSYDEIEGLRAYKKVADLPEVPDVALVITPAQTVPGVIAECGAKGIRNAIVFSSGFEEVAGGQALADQLSRAALEHGVAVLGPNCQGVWSVRNKSLLTFSPTALNREEIRHAPIAIVSQSGALAGALANGLLGSGLGCSYIVSVGNETCLDALDALGRVIEQPDVRAVALYIEGLDRAARLLAIAERARDRGVQIVVLKAGRSEVGRQATASHTGKIASSHAIYRELLEQAGIVSVDSLRDLAAAMEVLAYLPNPRSSEGGKGGVSVMSSSGGAAALLADLSADHGLHMTEFSAQTVARLGEVLPDFGSKANPIDLTGQVNTDRELFRKTGEAVVADPGTEAVIVQFSSSGRRYMSENREVFKAMARSAPVVVSFIGEMMEPEVRQDSREAGVLLSPDPCVSMWALSLLYRRKQSLSLPRLPQRKALLTRPVPRTWQETMTWLEDSALTPAKWVVLRPEERAASACAALQYPLVVKVLPSESEHKTELGLVKLRVQTPEEVDQLAAAFRARMGKPAAGILVQEMVGEGVEVVLSCLRNTDFGPVLTIGSGGVAIELYQDVTHLALPTSKEHVLAALKKLKLWTLLQGFRGKPAADADALAEGAVRFGDMFLATPGATEFEINPVIVRPRGEGIAAVDALVTAEA
jgi:acetate---CoA ligase (ADP-forming)